MSEFALTHGLLAITQTHVAFPLSARWVRAQPGSTARRLRTTGQLKECLDRRGVDTVLVGCLFPATSHQELDNSDTVAIDDGSVRDSV